MASTNVHNPRIQYLTDELIDIYSGGYVLTSYEDVNKKFKYYDKAVEGGVLDGIIFGSMFESHCNCGKTRIVGRTCQNCGSTYLDEATSWRRYARIELPIYYVPSLRKNNFYKFMEKNFKFDFKCSDEFMGMITGRGKNLELLFDVCQFSYDEENSRIIVTDQITDPNLCSYEGLIQIIIEHYPQHMTSFKQFINSRVLVVPMPVRAPRYVWNGKAKELQNHQITSVYKCIIRAVTEYYEQAKARYSEPVEIALLRAGLRRFVAKNMDLISELLRTSKENYSRVMQSHRLSNSGRCTIVPAPDLKVNEVYVPRHLMYEACRGEFINYLMEQNGWTEKQAEYEYVNSASSEEIQKQFEDYVDHGNGGLGKHVIINRNPTLYELSMFSCKVKLTNNYTMGIPLLLCSPLGGDFDGDSMSFYVIPDEIAPSITEHMSPKNLIYYKKNQKPLYLPSHEMMAGLLISTKVFHNPEEIRTFVNYDEANQFRKTHRDFKWQTECTIDSKRTTLARAKLSELFGTDLDEYIQYQNEIAIKEGKKGIDCLTSDLIVPLYDKMADFDDRTDRIQQIQEFALMISTLSGATAPRLSELHANLDSQYLDRIREVEDSDKLSASEKDIKIREIYDEFLNDSRNGTDENGKPRISTEVRRQVSESSRAKESQLLSMIMPQLNVGTDKVAHVGESSLYKGMKPTDYVRHSIENRLVQDIKQSAVPRSGYTTRQTVTLGASYFFTEEKDEKNPGIEIPKYRAAGRTTVDGSIISIDEANHANKKDKVRVRSLVTCTFHDKSLVPSDTISNINKWNEGDNVGISLLSSMTEGLTQAGLSLKHGGYLFETDKLSCIKAPEAGTVQVLDNFIIFKGDSGKEYSYPKPSNFVIDYSPSGRYEMGKVVGVAYRLFTPSYKLDSVINLIGAQSCHSSKTVLNNKVLVTECYAYGDGCIKYVTTGSGGKITGIKIGEYYYDYNPEACYFLPEGTQVKAGDRFCTGLLNLNKAIHKLNDYIKIFYLFMKQFDELIPGMQPELIEMIYSIVVRKVNGVIKHTKVIEAVRQTGTLYTNMAFMDSRRILSSIPLKGTEFLMDAFSSILLPSLFMLRI